MIKTELKSDFPCVYSINGVLHEDGEVNFDQDGVYFATVLPLDAIYLPYTVKFVGSNPITNRELCRCITTPTKKYLLFTKRYNYVYSPTGFDSVKDGVCAFFYDVKSNKFQKAKEKMSKSLSQAVTDEKLSEFFEKHDGIIKLSGNDYLITDEKGNGEIFCFVQKDGLIDDIFTK